ncbi:hypothetical protein L9F63_013754 [Diploptera punctata]|uniref:Uncharacterized protein n=1 Tax=Diploptera punctata TaxID=6984 RepID=A0AAD8ABK8_DIPPU|nr:hypothetical protein L9F63_013754 [Diploptera punctata]
MSGRQVSGCKQCTCGSGQTQLRYPLEHPLAEDDKKEKKEFLMPVLDCGSHMCIAEPCRKDTDKTDDRMKLANRVWRISRPPYGFSRPIPTVTARRVQVTRAQLLGQLKGSPISSVPCPPAVCPQSLLDKKSTKVPDTSIIFEATTSQKKRTISGTNFC